MTVFWHFWNLCAQKLRVNMLVKLTQAKDLFNTKTISDLDLIIPALLVATIVEKHAILLQFRLLRCRS